MPASSVVRSTVDSLTRIPAIFCNTRSAPSAKLPKIPANAVISSAAGVNKPEPSLKTPSHGFEPCRHAAQ
jgi:hypothetical protein